ncbi:SNF2 domain-containing protein CLASSY 4 [Cajanus cajan]|uniref:SNF2 domain-containing protein CLASSY 4 n=1 Tax=Cajanus cajan TaxID=3821 RepID=UPI00098D8F0D|nr:SNF2 domain-containing protein CLASSY 4 [Cajanus cajan]
MYQQGLPVAFRTRSYKKESVVRSDLITSRKRKRVDEHHDDDDDVVFVEVKLEGEGGASGKVDSGRGASSSSHSSFKGERVSEFLGENVEEPIEIDDSDDDGSGDEEGLRPSEKRVEVSEEGGSQESKGCSVFADKVENFGDHRGSGGPEDPILLTVDGDSTSEEEEEEDEEDGVAGSSLDDDGYDFLLSQTESEDGETSDEDFQVDDKNEYSSGEDNDSWCEDHRGRCRKIVKERVRKLESEAERRGVWRRRKGERKDNEQGEELEEQFMGADCASATSSKSEISKDEAKRVETVNAGAKVFGDHWEFSGCSMTSEAKTIEDKKRYRAHHSDHANDSVNLDNEGKEHRHHKETCMRSVSVLPESQGKTGDSARVVIKDVKRGKPQPREDWFNSNDREKVSVVDDEIRDKYHEVLRMPSRRKVQGFEFFTECFWGKHDSDKDGSHVLEEKDSDVGHEGQSQPLACSEVIPLNWNSTKEEPIEKSESEKELEKLWDELDMVIRGEEIGSQVGNIGTNEARENEETSALHCKHDFIFNEEIGIQCRWCGWVATEIKYITPPFVDSKRSGKRVSSGGVNNTSQFHGDLFDDSGKDSRSEADLSRNDGTVWDLIPDIKQSLYPHQQEGFEFIWTNLEGTTNLAKLKKVDAKREGGCIISHAPGTGKTKLTMVFLQTYLQVFPKCLPVIIAPSNILLTWEDELRKWNIGIPFHNMNNAVLSGKEHGINEIDWFGNQRQNKDAIRMIKLCSWYKEKSILLISYNLYEKLAGGKSEVDMEKEKKNRKEKKEKKRARTREKIETAIGKMGKVLREYPGLLVLDEGHTPRNQQSCIWKVLSESRSHKRILLSGTPFQNNFVELYNILCLMKPSFPDSIPQKLKKFCQSRLRQEKKSSKDFSWEPDCSGNSADEKIKQLKLLMNPFVNVHKGSILQKNLPGLRDCVLVLKPDSLQQETLESIECSQNVLNFEHKLALVSVHPSLFLDCSLSKQEESVVDKDKLENLRLNPYVGVKTKFLIEFIRLCDAVNEKVLVFSQFIDTLSLIKDQLESAFNWSVGTEVLYMYGKLDQKQKQSLIHSFNDANSQAKVLLASIKASSEGINLIGASRVVLLDVVWNPSVERQAICRAYRLGQKRVVYTYHLLAQGTPECTKYCKQAEKNRLSELVFSNRNAESDNLKISGVKFEDRVLDIMVQHEKLKGMFGERLVQP